MDNKTIIGTAAAVTIGTLVYFASKDGFGAEDTKCVNGVYRTQPKPDSDIWKTANYSWATITDGSEEGIYTITKYKHKFSGSAGQGPSDEEAGSKSLKGIEAAMKAAKDMIPKGYIWDKTNDYCNQEETEDVPPPSNEDEETATATGTTTTDWCAVKANSPKHIKAIPSQIKSEIAKIEKEGAEELARLEARYEKAKKECSAKEQVEEKLKDADLGEGFWEKLLAFLTAN